MIRQGFLTTNDPSGISLFTMLPAPITLLLPMVTPDNTHTCSPIHTLSLPVLKYAFPYKPLPNNCILCPAENTIKIPY